MKVLGLLLLLAVPGFGQVTTDCREVYPGKVRCYSTDDRIPQLRLGDNRIQIPDFVGDNRRRDWDRMEGMRRSMETRALIDQMRSQTELNNALRNQLNQRPAFVPEPGQKTAAELRGFLNAPPTSPAEAPKQLEYPEVYDYIKGLLARNKAGELSAEMFKSLGNLKLNEWVDSLRDRGVTPIEVDKLIAMAKAEIKPMKSELK